MADPLRIGLSGDVMLGREVNKYQRRRPPEAVWGNLLNRLRTLDGLLINLECCLSTRGERWTETNRPFHFRADPDWAVPALREASVDSCALANNHMLDFGEIAFLDTLEALDDAGISHAGAGRDAGKARAPVSVSIGNLTIALVSLTDNTPEYAADRDSPGTAYVEFDVENDRTRQIVEAALSDARAMNPDLLVASLHWGPNMVEEPPPEFRAFGRWLVEAGVDIVHGHSAHVFQGIEIHENRPIIYDAGDFVDDYAVDRDLRNDRSFLFEVRVRGDDLTELRLFPTEIYDCCVHQAGETAASWSRERMRALSDSFGTVFDRDGPELVCSLS